MQGWCRSSRCAGSGELTIRENSSSHHDGRLHCLARGKIFLAHLDKAQLDHLLEDYRLEPYGPRTIVTKRDLLVELNKVREDGYAICIDESSPGVSGLAVPVTDGSGNLLLTVGIGVPTVRADSKTLSRLVDVPP